MRPTCAPIADNVSGLKYDGDWQVTEQEQFMLISSRARGLLGLALMVALSSGGVAQESYVARAKKVSSQTGRPILAVAGSNT